MKIFEVSVKVYGLIFSFPTNDPLSKLLPLDTSPKQKTLIDFLLLEEEMAANTHKRLVNGYGKDIRALRI